MAGKNCIRLFLCLALTLHSGNCDISEYFQKMKSDAQMDFFKKLPSSTFNMESRSPPDVDFSDYYDYFGIEPTRDTEMENDIEDHSNELNVASDILRDVKKPSNQFSRKTLKVKDQNSRYPYKKRNPVNYHKDNIAVASSPSSKMA